MVSTRRGWGETRKRQTVFVLVHTTPCLVQSPLMLISSRLAYPTFASYTFRENSRLQQAILKPRLNSHKNSASTHTGRRTRKLLQKTIQTFLFFLVPISGHRFSDSSLCSLYSLNFTLLSAPASCLKHKYTVIAVP